MEEALWKLEDKWKLSTKGAVLVLASTAFLLIGLCTITILKRRALKKQRIGEKLKETKPEPRLVKKVLVGSVRWSKTSKWKESPRPLLKGKGMELGEVGWQSHNSDSPVWQRPILMGEKCEFPRYSGLILYDERGRPVCEPQDEVTHQEMEANVERTTLRDFLL